MGGLYQNRCAEKRGLVPRLWTRDSPPRLAKRRIPRLRKSHAISATSVRFPQLFLAVHFARPLLSGRVSLVTQRRRPLTPPSPPPRGRGRGEGATPAVARWEPVFVLRGG